LVSTLTEEVPSATVEVLSATVEVLFATVELLSNLTEEVLAATVEVLSASTEEVLSGRMCWASSAKTCWSYLWSPSVASARAWAGGLNLAGLL
jgi:hypothetical protein